MKKSEFVPPPETTTRVLKPRGCSVMISPIAKEELADVARDLAVAGLGALPPELYALAASEGNVNGGPFTNGVVMHLAIRCLRERTEGWIPKARASKATRADHE